MVIGAEGGCEFFSGGLADGAFFLFSGTMG